MKIEKRVHTPSYRDLLTFCRDCGYDCRIDEDGTIEVTPAEDLFNKPTFTIYCDKYEGYIMYHSTLVFPRWAVSDEFYPKVWDTSEQILTSAIEIAKMIKNLLVYEEDIPVLMKYDEDPHASSEYDPL